MKFAYKFSHLLGSVYKKGDLLFTPDGNSVISTVGNRISVFDIRNNKATTLSIESRYNYTALDLSPNGCILIAINEEGEAHMISLVSQTIVYKYRFKRKVRAVKFSPDGKHFAVCKENKAFVFKAPGAFVGQYNAFEMERVYTIQMDDTTCLDWSYDSRILAVGSKDMKVRLYPLERWENFKIYTLGSHTDGVVGCFFEEDSYDMITISRNGHTCIWECTVNPEDLLLKSKQPPKKKQRRASDSEEDDIDITKSVEKTDSEMAAALSKVSVEEESSGKPDSEFYYKRLARHFLADEARKSNNKAVVTSTAYHKKTKILVIGFSNGTFFIYEAPDMSMIHSLSISEQTINSIAINSTGDWIALGCGGLGQLLVWEWQSECHVLKQQGHATNMMTVAFSPDGQTVATGGDDGKVKLWNIISGFCYVTFGDHASAVTQVVFCGVKKSLVSSSLDGTVRAYDVLRYRNFRTFTSPNPQPVQFTCVSVDSSGEFVAAGGQDVFEIFLWSMKTGQILEILGGHEAPVSSVSFSPSLCSSQLVSVSWDKTLRVWEALESRAAHETIDVLSDGLCVAYRPDGQHAAVATLDGRISVFEVKTARQVASIEGRYDLGSGRADTDLVTAKQTLQARAFTSLCYSADGEYLLAGGQSKNVCIYHVNEGLIIKKFEITQNRSLDAVDDFINRRKMVEMVGNKMLVEEREETEGGNVKIKLPGVRSGDMASRVLKPEVRVFALQFSPTGQQWAAVTTEGLLIYSLNIGMVFDPWDLQLGVTPDAVKKALQEKDYSNALIMSIKLNEAPLIQNVMEQVPLNDVELLISSLAEKYVERLLIILASCLESSNHLEYYLLWVRHVLRYHGPKLKAHKNLPSLLALEKSLVRKYDQLANLCDHNKYMIRYVKNLQTKSQKMEVEEQDSDEEFVMSS